MLIEVPTPGTQFGASARRSEGSEDFSERRTVIKNKILAVGRMARVFAVLRCVLYAYAVRKPSECPNSRLLLARAGCRTVLLRSAPRESRRLSTALRRPARSISRTSVYVTADKLTPTLIAADDGPPAAATAAPPVAGGNLSLGRPLNQPNYIVRSPVERRQPTGHRPTHSRTSSLGTTMSSPSNRRRSLESTVSMIKEALEQGGPVGSRRSPSNSPTTSPRR